jgi:hypothetical protein
MKTQKPDVNASGSTGGAASRKLQGDQIRAAAKPAAILHTPCQVQRSSASGCGSRRFEVPLMAVVAPAWGPATQSRSGSAGANAAAAGYLGRRSRRRAKEIIQQINSPITSALSNESSINASATLRPPTRERQLDRAILQMLHAHSVDRLSLAAFVIPPEADAQRVSARRRR